MCSTWLCLLQLRLTPASADRMYGAGNVEEEASTLACRQLQQFCHSRHRWCGLLLPVVSLYISRWLQMRYMGYTCIWNVGWQGYVCMMLVVSCRHAATRLLALLAGCEWSRHWCMLILYPLGFCRLLGDDVLCCDAVDNIFHYIFFLRQLPLGLYAASGADCNSTGM